MSSDSDYIASLLLAQTTLYKFGGTLLMIIGTVSCILSSAVFTKKNLRKNPCSIYFLAYNITSLLAIYTVILPQTLSKGFQIDLSFSNLPFCRFRLYTLLLSDVLGPSYLILASVDRALLTSRNALTRQRSTRRLAYISVASVTLFWLSAESHTLVLGSIITFGQNLSGCYYQLGNYYVFITYYSVIVKGILIPLLMLIAGLWTIKNVRGLGRVAPAASTATNVATGNADLRVNHSKDRQLFRILLADISIYLIFNLMQSVVLTYQQIIPNQSKTNAEAQSRLFLVYVGSFSCYVPFCIGFYNNLFVSKTFRRETKEVLMCR